MATVNDTKTPYEILIRFGLDGLPKGAHCQYLRRVTVDGEVLKEDIGMAEPLDLAGFPTSAIMSDTTRDALAQVTTLEGEKVTLTDQLNAAGDLVAQLTSESQALQRQVLNLREDAAVLRGVIEQAEADKAALTAQLAAMTQERDSLEDRVGALVAAQAAEI